MQIFVKALTGKVVALEIASSADVRAIKAAIEDAEGVPSGLQTLTLGGRPLVDSMSLEEAAVSSESALELNLDLLGAGKKRKKKVYTTPKVIHHKHKSEKLATLKFYKVDDDGKIVKQRLECPAPICGKGVFMALHHNRHYCGKCGRYAPREGSD